MKNLNSFLNYEDGFAILDLSRQKLTSIPKGINKIAEEINEKFKNKERPWKEINLSYNNIKKITKEDFLNLNHFDIIHFIGIKINKLPHEIKYLTNPIVLNFSFSDLQTLPEEIYNLTQLRSLRVNWTSIENFDESIENLQKLSDIEVSETPFIRTIYSIQDNNNKPKTEEEKKVWKIKKILEKMGCEIEE